MNDSDAPFDHSPRYEEPPASEFGEPLPAPLTTREQGEVMDATGTWQVFKVPFFDRGQLIAFEEVFF